MNALEPKNVLVCVTGQRNCERLIVAGAKQAEALGGHVFVLHVAAKGNTVMGWKDEPQALEYLLQASVRHGADMVVVRNDDVVGTLEQQAREHRVAMVVAGRAADYRGWDLLDTLKTRLPECSFEILPA